MNSLNRRQLTLSLFAGTMSTALGGCSTIFEKKSPDQKMFFTENTDLKARHVAHPDRKVEFDKWWDDIVKHTNAIPVSNDRIHIQSTGVGRSKADTVEQNFLLRAAIETLRDQKTGFVILQLDYYKTGLAMMSLTPDISLSNRRWIGTYEDLRKDRVEQNIFSSRNAIRKKGMEGVILQLNEDDLPHRARFSASEIYLNLLEHQAP